MEYLKDEDFQALEKNKAVGDIASRYFDINGNIALKELDDRVVGFGLEELREKEWTIAIAVGVNKASQKFKSQTMVKEWLKLMWP